jgi:hypothetical protein
MRARFWFTVLAALVAATVLTSATGASTAKHAKVARIDVSTRTAVIHYLRSIHVSTKGVVIQRGLRNYAGTHCPGTHWACANTRHTVVQIAERGGQNRFVCRSSKCVVVQLSGVSHGFYIAGRRLASTAPPPKGGSTAVCVKNGSGSPAGSGQSCTINQSGSGPNMAVVWENSQKVAGLTTSLAFTAVVTQQATGSTQGNTACATQNINLDGSTTGLKAKPVTVTLEAHQSITIRQDSTSGNNAASNAAVLSGTTATCDTSTALGQNQTVTSTVNSTAAITQNENAASTPCGDGVSTHTANVCLDIEQNKGISGASGTNNARFTQTSNLQAVANTTTGPVSQTQSSPDIAPGFSGLVGTVNQDSTGVSTASVTQLETQCEDAATSGETTCQTNTADAPPFELHQTQYGPEGIGKAPNHHPGRVFYGHKGYGQATQTGNGADTFTITQISQQDTDQGPGSDQHNTVQADCQTSGNCTASQTTTVDGSQNMNVATGSNVSASTTCTGSTCAGTIPAGAPPAPVIDSHPPNPSNSSSATFTFHDTNTSATFLCQLDGGGYSACTSPKTYTGLLNGSHTFNVEATQNGNTSDPATFTWTVASVLIIGNNAAFGGGPIQTYDFATGALVNSFVPDGAAGSNGRGVTVVGNEIFYTELSNSPSFGPSDGIHVAPFNNGAGGSDLRVLPNPAPSTGIQDLAYAGGYLYALTGYNQSPLQVWKLNPSTGSVIGGAISISGPASDADGFTVLPDGNFLINDGDTLCTYREYNSSTGVATGNSLSVPGAPSTCTGVETDGTSLYFQTSFNSFTKTDLSGTFISKTTVTSNSVEDISLG